MNNAKALKSFFKNHLKILSAPEELDVVKAEYANDRDAGGEQMTPAFTFLIDDARVYDYTLLKDVFVSRNIPMVLTPYVNGIATGMSQAQLLEMQNIHGCEIASHGIAHTDFTALTDAQLTAEMKGSKDALTAMGFNINNIVYPLGNYNEKVMAEAKKYYHCAPTLNSEGFYNTAPIMTYKLQRFGMATSGQNKTYDQYKALIDEAVSRKAWMITLTHGVEFFNFPEQVTILGQVLDYLISINVPILTLEQGYQRFKNKMEMGFKGRNKWSTGNAIYDYFGNYSYIGCNGKFESNASSTLIVSSKEYLAQTPLTKYQLNKISVCAYTLGDSQTFIGSNAGTMFTHYIGQVDMGFQEWHPYTRSSIYRRRWDATNNVWLEWVIQSTRLQTEVTLAGAVPASSFLVIEVDALNASGTTPIMVNPKLGDLGDVIISQVYCTTLDKVKIKLYNPTAATINVSRTVVVSVTHTT